MKKAFNFLPSLLSLATKHDNTSSSLLIPDDVVDDDLAVADQEMDLAQEVLNSESLLENNEEQRESSGFFSQGLDTLSLDSLAQNTIKGYMG